MAVVECLGEAEGFEETLGEELVVGFSRDFLDDDTEEIVAGVVVEEARPGIEPEGDILEAGDDVVPGEAQVHLLPVDGKAGEALDPGGVIEQVAHPDGLPGLGVIGEDIGERVVEGELPVLDEQEDGGGGELLGDGADAVDGRGARGDFPLEVGVAIALGEPCLAALGDPDAQPRRFPGSDDGRGGPIDEGFQSGGRFCRSGESATSEGEEDP